MGQQVIVDSSVAVKWFAAQRESHVEEAYGLLERHRSGELELVVPSHLRLEVLNALWRRQWAGADLQSASRGLHLANLTWCEVDQRLADAAATIAVAHRLTIYDAVFAALANELDCELVTADKRLAESGACRARLLGE